MNIKLIISSFLFIIYITDYYQFNIYIYVYISRECEKR